MPTLHDGPLVRVRQGWLTGWRVDCRTTGATVIPTPALQHSLARAWHLMRAGGGVPPEHLRACEDQLMQLFGLCALDPSAPLARDFAAATPAQLCQGILAAVTAK